MSAGPPNTWVLLRGLTRERGHWGAFPKQLALQLGPQARIVTLDLPGNGALHGMASPASIAATMAHCRAQLQALAIDAPVHLLAMSLGAMVAVEWAVRHPQELAGCVLVNTSMRPFSPFYRRLRPANYAPLIGLALWPRSSLTRERAVLRLTTRLQPYDTPVVTQWAALRDRHPVSAGNALRQLLAAARYRAPREAPAVPLLVLGSAHDTLVHASCSRRLAHQWQAELREHPSAGHDLPQDDGHWLAAQVAQWRAQHD